MTIKSLIFSGFIGGTLLLTSAGIQAQTIDDFESGQNWVISGNNINVDIGLNLTDPINGSRDLKLNTISAGAPLSFYTISRTDLDITRESINDRFSFKYKTLLALSLGKSATVTLTGTDQGSATPKTYSSTQPFPVLSIGDSQTFTFLFSNFTPSASNLEKLQGVSISFNVGLLNLSVNEQIDDIIFTRSFSNVNDWNLY